MESRVFKESKWDSTYVDLLPLRDVSDEPGEAEEPDEREELGQAEDAEGAAGVEDLEALGVFLKLETRESAKLRDNKNCRRMCSRPSP